jgi:NAD-reducing hydrogenase small subunit
MDRLKLATVWLGGCSGCHMSFLDLDEWLFDLAAAADVVFTPLADFKQYPEDVDAVLVEGAVANDENLEFIRKVRSRSRFLIAFGDCAITGNVTALRNLVGPPRRPVAAELFGACRRRRRLAGRTRCRAQASRSGSPRA